APVVWLGNGRGQFDIAGNLETYRSELNRLFGSENGAEFAFSIIQSLVATCPDQNYCPALSAHIRPQFLLFTADIIAGSYAHRSLEQYFPYLRERGPPLGLV